MNRIDRLSAILVMLQTKKIVKASEIAERFDISLRTVYRDMHALDEGGVPIGAEPGVGYYLIEGYHLPPVMFTPEEAGSLLVADKLLNCFSDQSIKQNFRLATDKIKAVLPKSHQEFLGQIEANIHVFHKPLVNTEEYSNNYITQIQQAIAENKSIQLQYFSKSKEEDSNRIVEPIGLCFYGFSWHLIAFCQLRNGYRDFRLDRIKQLEINKQKISDSAKISISDYFNKHWETGDLFNVCIQFNKAKCKEITNSRYYYGFYYESTNNNITTMKFAVNDYGYISTWLLSLGEVVVKIDTPELDAYIKRTVKKLSQQYLIV